MSQILGSFGSSHARIEDDRLLRGEGRFLDDLQIPGALHAAFVRSDLPHAKIKSIDVTAALASPGVVAVYTGADIAGRVEPLLNTEELRVPPGIATLDPIVKLHPVPLLAIDEVRFVGQPIAVVIAESRYLAEDGAEEVEVDFEELESVVDPHEALREGAPLAILGEEDNVGIQVRHGKGDVDGALGAAHAVVTERFSSQRYVAASIETRGIAVQPDPFSGKLVVWSTTQTPHRLRDHIATGIGRAANDVRVVSVDVGGGFGPKGILVVEELLIPFIADDLNRAVRWTEDRRESLVAGLHAREQTHDITLAADADGRLVAVRDRIVVNFGAANFVGLVVPYNALCHLVGPYKIDNVDIEAVGAVTNTAFTAPYRGAGRPEAAFAMERAIDRLARKLDMDPVELRRRNLIQADEMPFKTGLLDRRGLPQEYDSGNYPEMLDRAVELIDLDGVRARQVAARAEGRFIGVGFSIYLEMSGLGPFEGATAALQPSGRVHIYTGAPSQGQGHKTVFAQVAADALGVEVERIDLIAGDTALIPYGVGTIASRGMVTAGNAIHQAATNLGQRIREVAANMLEASPDDLVIEGDRVAVTGTPSASVGFGELMRAVPMTGVAGGDDGLQETSYFQPPNYATASGLHAAVVEVDVTTGEVSILDYAVVHEAGRIVNPVIADAQVVGGVVQGIGGALLEHLQYDPDGQPLTTTLMDYLLPTSSTVPNIKLAEVVCPSPTNALGVKGLGEGGAVGPPGALANAVEDALSPFGVVVHQCPLTPSRIRDLLRTATN